MCPLLSSTKYSQFRRLITFGNNRATLLPLNDSHMAGRPVSSVPANAELSGEAGRFPARCPLALTVKVGGSSSFCIFSEPCKPRRFAYLVRPPRERCTRSVLALFLREGKARTLRLRLKVENSHRSTIVLVTKPKTPAEDPYASLRISLQKVC